jgi:PAS domain S-box-containing protein
MRKWLFLTQRAREQGAPEGSAHESGARLLADRAREVLGEPEDVFRTVWEHAADAMALSDREGIVIAANPAYYQLYGFTPDEVLGQSFAIIFPPDQRDSAALQHQQIFDSDIPPPLYESVVRRADGSERIVESRIEFITVDGRRTAMLSMIRDITARKRAELALREETETIQTINRIGQLLSAELDLQKLVQAVTDAATELSGAKFGAFFYNQIDEHGESYTLYTLSGTPAESFADFPMPRNTHIFGPTFLGERNVRLDDVTADPRYAHNPPYQGMPSGHLPVRSYMALPVTARSGEVIGGLFFGHPDTGMFTERSERLVAGLAAQAGIAMDNARLYQQANHAIQLRDQFLSIASHELKTPLTSLLGNAQLLQRRTANDSLLNERERRVIRVIVEQANRLNKMIAALLDISRLETGQLSITSAPLDLNDLARRVVEESHPALETRTLTLKTTPDAVLVAGDALRLEQVLQNLIGNAVKYSHDGDAIEVAVERRSGVGCIAVTDHGIGIPPEAQQQIFRRFYRAGNAADHISGIGIGLFIVKEIITLHSGTVDVESVEGQGSTFTVCLPLL